MTCAFVADHKIDSYLKLRVLLSMHKQPQRSLSLDELCEQFFVADRYALEQLIAELCQRGLLNCDGVRWTGSDQPAITHCLACLERTFNDPQARQRLLDQVTGRRTDYVN
jgi:hypothetical protein